MVVQCYIASACSVHLIGICICLLHWPSVDIMALMELEKHVEEYINLCKHIYESFERRGSWPWDDSTLSEDLVDSEYTPDNL